MDEHGERLIASLYEGLTDRAGWQDFVEGLGRALGAQALDVVTEDHAARCARSYGSVGFDPAYRESYDPDYVGANPWIRTGLRADKPAVRCSPEIDGPGLEQTDYYRNWLQPQDLRYAMGTMLRRDGPRLTLVSAMRARRCGPFPVASRHLLARLAPHLRTAMDLTERFEGVRGERDMALSALDAQAHGILLADRHGRVLQLNRQAEVLLPEGGALFVGREGRLVCRSMALHRRLEAALARACRADGHGADPASLLLVEREGAAPLRLKVQPFVERSGALPVTRQCALLTLLDLSAHALPGEWVLRQALGLSPAECRLALALARGEPLAAHAAASGIAPSTARTLLKRAMAKTGARRQSELVRQVTLVAGLDR